MRQASIDTKISPKTEEKEIASTGLQSMHGREGGKFDEKKNIKLKPMHKHFIHTLHDMSHQAYVFLSEIGMQNEEGFYTR